MPATVQFIGRLPVGGPMHFPTLVDNKGERYDAGWCRAALCRGAERWYRAVGMKVGGRVAVRATDDPMAYSVR